MSAGNEGAEGHVGARFAPLPETNNLLTETICSTASQTSNDLSPLPPSTALKSAFVPPHATWQLLSAAYWPSAALLATGDRP